MTFWEFAYIIGFTLSFIIGFININSLIPEEEYEKQFIPMLILSLILGFLSWGLVLWAIYEKFYRKKYE